MLSQTGAIARLWRSLHREDSWKAKELHLPTHHTRQFSTRECPHEEHILPPGSLNTQMPETKHHTLELLAELSQLHHDTVPEVRLLGKRFF